MSKTSRNKITVEIAKSRDLNKIIRPSVFERLGTKKFNIPVSQTDISKQQQQLQEDPKRFHTTLIQDIDNLNNKLQQQNDNNWDQQKLEDEDPDILEKRRLEIQKELELQLKMDSTTSTLKKSSQKEIMNKKHKRIVRSSSSSGSSSSTSGTNSSSDDSTSTSSTTSRESRRKIRKKNLKQSNRRDSSSSSDNNRSNKKLAGKSKHAIMKKMIDSSKKVVHLKKIGGQLIKSRKRSQTPQQLQQQLMRKQRSATPTKLLHKSQIKVKNLSISGDRKKHHPNLLKEQRLREKEKEREKDQREREKEKEREREREREREKLRLREKERGRSRTPKIRMKSRSPRRASRSRDGKKKSPDKRITPTKIRANPNIRRERSMDRRQSKEIVPRKHENSRDRERREREQQRQEREAARNKEREEALARCQERQRERERLAKEKSRRLERGGGGRDEIALDKSLRALPRMHREEASQNRLLPRPAERERALALASGRNDTPEKIDERQRSHSHNRSERHERLGDKEILPPYERGYESSRQSERSFHVDHHDRRIERDDRTDRELEREYLVARGGGRNELRDGSPFETRSRTLEDREPYNEPIEKQRYDDHSGREERRLVHDYPVRDYSEHRRERERDWDREHEHPRDTERGGRMYERSSEHHPSREWERGSGPPPPPHNTQSHEYSEQREWQSERPERQWDEKDSWQQEKNVDDWPVYSDRAWVPPLERHRDHNEHIVVGSVGGVGVGGSGGSVNRRWTSSDWQSGSKDDVSTHHIEYRRPTQIIPPQEIIEERPEIFRRHPHVSHVDLGHPSVSGPYVHNQNLRLSHNQNEVHVPIKNIYVKRNIPMRIIEQPKIVTIPTIIDLKTKLIQEQQQQTSMITASATTPIVIKQQTTLLTPVIKVLTPIAVVSSPPTITSTVNFGGCGGGSTALGTTTALSSIDDPDDDDLSEISDDADEILNQTEELNESVISDTIANSVLKTRESTIPSIEANITSVGQLDTIISTPALNLQTATTTVAPAINKQIINNDAITNVIEITPTKIVSTTFKDEINNDVGSKYIQDEMDLDFEEISDGELEEEARTKGLGDALGVDWASLIQESRKITIKDSTIETTAKQRWQPHHILLEVGISLVIAGENFTNNLILNANEKLKLELKQQHQEKSDNNEKSIKQEVVVKKEFFEQQQHDTTTSSTITENEKYSDDKKNVEKLYLQEQKQQQTELNKILTNSFASVQCAIKRKIQERKVLITKVTGTYSRALSARKDLLLRRRLCNLPEINLGNLNKNLKPNTEFTKMAIELFQKACS